MKSSTKSIEVLNLARDMELQAIAQYMGHHYVLSTSGYSTLATTMRRIAVQEMHHAEMLGVRIRELGGQPLTATTAVPDTSDELATIYSADERLEADTSTVYETFIIALEENSDTVSAQLIKKILIEEEAHLQYFLDQSKHLTDLGDVYRATLVSSEYGISNYINYLLK